MAKKAIVGLVVVALAIGVWWLWPRGESASPVSTTVLAAEPTTTSERGATTSTVVSSTTETATDSHIVDTVEEAEEILRELWFGWFEGIYNQDEDRIREVVGNPAQVEAAVSQFGLIAFTRPPNLDDVAVSGTELLRADEECLSVWAQLDFSAISGAETEGVHVFLPDEGNWFFVSLWTLKEDLWETDCGSRLGQSR
jgi:hypothetical protein